ncbi:glycoside hydrolase family 97 protein [Lentzea sp. NBRC 105346]|uniref:glycoside hydrolase family 97 protein n=1 Tax=Lentzea sp. NBRC 105346 TaxID=3032205 RepID=UPI002552105B|nr:glycoside hydrolase family 97 protein [Lentzea sp. NBRC 105346]
MGSRKRSALLAAVCVVAAGAGLIGTTPALAAQSGEWRVTAPSRSTSPEAVVKLDRGKLTLSVKRGATTVLEPSALGIRTADADLTDGLRFVGLDTRLVHDEYTTTTGRRLKHEYTGTENTFHLQRKASRLDLVVRVSDDGVAYRYVLPEQRWATVLGEASEFAVPAGVSNFLLPYDNGRSDYESAHVRAPEQGVEYGYPSLFNVKDTWLLIAESDVDGRYGGSRLTYDGSRYRLTLPDPAETANGPLATPWRTMIVGDLPTVTESDLITDLAPPSKISDTSWIKPGRAVWSWWGDGTGNLDLQKKYADYAAKQGYEYNLVDSGWAADWIPPLVQHSKAKGVDTWIWVRWQTIDTDSERERLFAQYRSWGVVGLKIDFVESDGQDRMRWYDAVLAAAAKYHLMLNFHGAPIPRGTERTWPHVMSVEAVKGAEGTKPRPGREPFPIEHYLTLPFTRNLTGPMDFTPVTFTGVRPNSDAAELALSVLFESGVQHFADKVDSYTGYPVAEQFLRGVPTVWDETQLVAGDPGKLAVFARRSGARWFIGAGVAGDARDLTVPTSFLGSGSWLVEVYHDSPTGKIAFDTKRVTAGEALTVPVARNGGYAARLCQAPPTAASCG